MRPARAALWSRVSTAEQTAENQLREFRVRAEADGATVVREYVLVASAYQGEHQGQLHDLHKRADRREIDAVYVWALDRLSREGIAATLAALQPLYARGVRVVSLKESWLEALAQPALRDLLVAIFGWVAEQESARRSERTKAGQVRAIGQGKRLGRPKGSKDRQHRRNRREADWRRRAGVG